MNNEKNSKLRIDWYGNHSSHLSSWSGSSGEAYDSISIRNDYDAREQTGGKMMSGNATGGMMKGNIISDNMTSGMMKGNTTSELPTPVGPPGP